MRIVVNDANILIDLVELELLPHFFDLQFEFHTTALVLDELFEEQQKALTPYIDQGLLNVADISAKELVEISLLQQSKPKLSEQDCSAFYQASTKGGTLITSDKNLRKYASEKDVKVHGHLWIFDKMVEGNTISSQRASEKLTELCEKINPRLNLPPKECEKRLSNWQNQ
jgi:predicted nucleic acid-binding protein